MNNGSNNEFTLLSDEQTFGSQKIDVIEQMGGKCAISDFAILLGSYVSNDYFIEDDSSLKGRTTWWWTRSSDGDGDVRGVNNDGSRDWHYRYSRDGAVRPALPFSSISDISPNGVRGRSGFLEVEYGEYPQYAVDTRLARTLDSEYSAGRLKKTGKTYTTDSRLWNANSESFKAREHHEYEYNGKKYVKVKYVDTDSCKLSNGESYQNGDEVWVEVAPIKWLVDEKSRLMLSKTCLASGVRFCDNGKYDGNFKNSEMYMFLNKYFAKDIIPSYVSSLTVTKNSEVKKLEKKINPYGFDFDNVSEEEIIKGMIESGVAVFLHGASSEGKSARVKQIDPTCEIIYLRNASPESLNGKSVYNGETGEMLDVKPTWLKKVEAKCESEPDRLHIVFFDEITNALPSIQGIAFNIVLDREVNGIWKLPDNARIVASGNEMEDSLSANQLAEPLFNRFAHVYIKTTTESWLKWASEHNIHPAIYTYIAYKKGKTLRSNFDGEKPNADPRKWEMASKVLYATGNPQMLRSLVGEDITKEFISFCKNKVITLDDVIEDNYDESEIKELNTAERYATAMTLSQVDEDNLEKVRTFVAKLGGECRAIFDSLWAHGDDERLEKIAELGQDIVTNRTIEKTDDIVPEDVELTLLTIDEVQGNKKLNVLEKYGTRLIIPDLAMVTDVVYYNLIDVFDEYAKRFYKKRYISYYYTKDHDERGNIYIVDENGGLDIVLTGDSNGVIRPVLVSPTIFSQVYLNSYFGDNGTYQVEFGEYPQEVASADLQKELSNADVTGKLRPTGRKYTFYHKYRTHILINHPEYEYKSERYIKVVVSTYDTNDYVLTNGEVYGDGDVVWLKVEPVTWLIDEENQRLISKYGLLSGVKFHRMIHRDFEQTEMYKFLNDYMLKDMLQSYKREKEKTKQLKK